MEKLLDTLQNRNLAENLRDLIHATSPGGREYRLNLIAYNTLLSNWFKGLITNAEFNTGTARIWDALFHFVGNEQASMIKKLETTLGIGKNSNHKSILFIASAPAETVRLQVDFEFQKIREAIESSTDRDRIELLTPLFAASLERFMIEKDKFKPSVIHFSGHGTNKSLVFSTGTNHHHEVSESILKEVFMGVGQYANCIVLNACYAAGQAKAISEQGVFVIGMNASIGDLKAIAFSSKFYRAIGESLPVEEAFKQARILVESEYPAEAGIIELWKDGEQVLQNMLSTSG
jgi:hypothetical protein